MSTEYSESLSHDLSDEQIARIAAAVAASLKAQIPIPVRKPKINFLGVLGLCVSIVAISATGIGSWVALSNRLATHDARLLNLDHRVETLEQSSNSVTTAATQITDLKAAFEDFRSTYRDDFRDLKMQVQTQTIQDSRKRGR